MEVLERTPDRLVIRVVPARSRMIGWGLAAFGLLLFVWGWFFNGGCVMFFVGAPLLMAAVGTLLQEPTQTLTFSRPDNRVRVEAVAIAGKQRWKANVDYLAKALVRVGSIAVEESVEKPDEAEEGDAAPSSLLGRWTASRHVMFEFKDGVRRAAVRHVESDAIAEDLATTINEWLAAGPIDV